MVNIMTYTTSGVCAFKGCDEQGLGQQNEFGDTVKPPFCRYHKGVMAQNVARYKAAQDQWEANKENLAQNLSQAASGAAREIRGRRMVLSSLKEEYQDAGHRYAPDYRQEEAIRLIFRDPPPPAPPLPTPNHDKPKPQRNFDPALFRPVVAGDSVEAASIRSRKSRLLEEKKNSENSSTYASSESGRPSKKMSTTTTKVAKAQKSLVTTSAAVVTRPAPVLNPTRSGKPRKVKKEIPHEALYRMDTSSRRSSLSSATDSSRSSESETTDESDESVRGSRSSSFDSEFDDEKMLSTDAGRAFEEEKKYEPVSSGSTETAVERESEESPSPIRIEYSFSSSSLRSYSSESATRRDEGCINRALRIFTGLFS